MGQVFFTCGRPKFFLHAVGKAFFTCGWPKFFLHAAAMENGPGDIKTEIVTKAAPVRAVDLSIGAFCTEFQREHFRDDGIFIFS